MRILNCDGTEAEMCGNGIRCIGKYLYERKLIHKNIINIETKSGIKKLKLCVEGSTVIKIEVNMGKANFSFEDIPIFHRTNEEYIEDCGYTIYPVSMGNPHAVCFVDNINKINLKDDGKRIENSKYFPNKTNVEFVEIIDKSSLKIRIWERGVGETLSCGTGICASAAVSQKYKSTNSDITVETKGGKLNVKCKENEIILSGSAEFVYEGKIRI